MPKKSKAGSTVERDPEMTAIIARGSMRVWDPRFYGAMPQDNWGRGPSCLNSEVKCCGYCAVCKGAGL